MFGKKKKNYDLTYENLAIPEILTMRHRSRNRPHRRKRSTKKKHTSPGWSTTA